tara:strand:- start:768 stop:1568 length:801 start_codon:yes stop_codon:yes gene_type:complete
VVKEYDDSNWREEYKVYYLYMIKFDDGRFYIGSRKSKRLPEKDTGYWGSPVTFKYLWEDTSLSKTKHILKVCDSHEEMVKLEPKWITEAWKKYGDLCLNRAAGPHIREDVCRKSGLDAVKNKTGIFDCSPEERRKWSSKAGKVGGKITAENKLGPFSFSKEERIKNASKAGKVGGKQNYENGVGLKPWYDSQSKEELFKLHSEAGKKGGAITGKKVAVSYSLISPEGEIFTGRNVSEFCKEHNLKRRMIHRVVMGQRPHHKGWRRV